MRSQAFMSGSATHLELGEGIAVAGEQKAHDVLPVRDRFLHIMDKEQQHVQRERARACRQKTAR